MGAEFRSNWLVDPATGEYTASIHSPTGIAADPALTAHGAAQARELAVHLRTLRPPVDKVYSSPYYRCLQTVQPFVSGKPGSPGAGERQVAEPRDGDDNDGGVSPADSFGVRAETGLGEWYGSAPFEHPVPAKPEVLKTLFSALDTGYQPITQPPRKGETIAELHNRAAATMEGIIAQCDREGTRAILICSHAAVVIALGRVLTGMMPDDVEAEDFGAFTCGLSVFQRRGTDSRHSQFAEGEGDGDENGEGGRESLVAGTRSRAERASSSPGGQTIRAKLNDDCNRQPSGHPQASNSWGGGRGVAGGWDCLVNSDCSFLKEGKERGWRFSGDEAFTGAGQPEADADLALGVVADRNSGRGCPEGANNKSRL